MRTLYDGNATRIALIVALFALPGSVHAQTTRSDSAFERGSGGTLELVAEDARETAGGSFIRDLSFVDDLQHGGDVSLVGITTSRQVTFGIPDYWELQGDPMLHLDVMRSSQLIPEVSAITVWADGRPIRTFMLDGDPGEVVEHEMRVPLASETGYHTLTFVAYHRSLLPCEISDHPGLWSRILGSSYLRVEYRPAEPQLSLSRWPYPFRDDRDPDPVPIVLVLPSSPSVEDVQAAGYIAAYLGHTAEWRPMDLVLHQGTLASAPDGHVIAFVRSDGKAAALGEVKAALSASPNPEVAAMGAAVRAGKLPRAGSLGLVPRPGEPSRAMLVLAGKDRAGLAQLALLLSGAESSALPVGQVEAVDSVEPPTPMELRRWEDTVPPEDRFTLAELGLTDQMARGYRGGHVTVPLRLVPDARPKPGAARMELIYSYSAQASTERSRLDVLVNDAAAGGTGLTDINGRNRETMLLDLPVHEMGPDSSISVRFSLVGLAEPVCLGETHDELWGTLHADSSITLPRDYWERIPDLALLRYGAYPFGLRADLSETLFVLPAKPTDSDVQLYLWLAAELGRVARGDRFGFGVRLGGIDQAKDEDLDLVVVDSGSEASILKSLGLLESMSFTVSKPLGVQLALASGNDVAIGADPSVSYIEQVQLPWNPQRSALVAYATDPTLFQRVGPCLDGGALIDRLQGRVTRVASCTDLAVIPLAEAREIGEQPARESIHAPVRKYYWLFFIGLLLLGVLIVLAVRHVQAQRAAREAEEADADGWDG